MKYVSLNQRRLKIFKILRDSNRVQMQARMRFKFTLTLPLYFIDTMT